MNSLVVFKVLLCIGITYGLEGSKPPPDDIPPQIVHQPSDVVVKAGNPATLSCRASGAPEPIIEWLRNGQPLDLERQILQPRPIVLSDGSLFFLSVVSGRRSQSHEGVYTCVARNNAGKAVSRNASLHIAALGEDFRTQPTDVEVAQGEVAIMNCSPPPGQPEPNVTWKKDGVPINFTNDHYTVLNGKLIIGPALKNDSGMYVCVASNTIGVRESQAARLSILVKPVLVSKPEDMTVKVGETAHFSCEVAGDPIPAVEWSREQGPLPNGRYLVNPGQISGQSSLQIHYVTEQDSGKYICTATNDMGSSTASAELHVEEALNTRQKELHKEISALRAELQTVAVMVPSSNMSLVQWKLQSLPSQPHYLDGCEVLYRSLLPASSDWAAKKVSLPSLQTQIGPLKRGYKYEFKLRPYGSGLYGRESNTRHLRVPEIAPGAPQSLSVTMPVDRNDTVRLSWAPPPHDTHNGIIQGYQVWCVQSDGQPFFNWTVDSGTHSLEIDMLQPGRQYWVRVAALNGAGVGVKSDPHRLLIENNQHASHPRPALGVLPRVLAIVQDPVFIGSVGVVLWFLLMVAAVCLYRRHGRNSGLGHRHHKSAGLYRLASEDLIIKHRMAAPDSPWISGAWRPALCGKPYQDLWAQGQDSPSPSLSLSKSTLPISAKKDPSHVESVVPIVPDSCGVYGTFYVDLSSKGLKTFNSPARRPKMPHFHHSSDQSCETVIIPQPVPRSKSAREEPALPWRRALPAQPNMGVLKESWEKNCKRELHAVKSAPLVPMSQQTLAVGSITSVNKQRLSHHPPALPPPGGFPDCLKVAAASSPRMLHYSASLHLVDMGPPQPSPPLCADDLHSLSSEEGSSRSTKLTMDMGSLPSLCAASASAAVRCPPIPTSPTATTTSTSVCPSYPGRTYSHLSTASFGLSAGPSLEDLDLDDATLSTQAATQYLEIRPRTDRAGLPDNLSPRPFSPTPTFGYICGPSEVEEMGERGGPQRGVSGRARLRSTPSSCCSEWEGSLWNAWGSVSEGNMPSARTSLISSSDCSFMNDANFARVLALTAESMTGANLSDFSPSGSPLNVLFPPPRDCFGELDPLPVWDWSTTWVEDMEAQYRAGLTGGAAVGANLSSVPDHWGYHHRQDSRKNNHKTPSHR